MSSSISIPDVLVAGEYIDVGDVAEITITTKDTDATLADPTTLVVTVQPEGGTSVSYIYGTDGELTKTSTGIYRLLHPVTAAYRHYVRAVTTGNAGAEPGSFMVRPNPIV